MQGNRGHPIPKTGTRVISLPPMAVKLLDNLPRDLDSPWVIPGAIRAPIFVNSLTPGRSSGRAPAWTMCGFMTFAIIPGSVLFRD